MDLIIGGGISGLSYAMFMNNTDYIIVEKHKEIGGYCRTIKNSGFVWDYSGHFFHFQDEEIKRLILGELIERNKVIEVEKHTCIKYKDRIIDYPFQKNIHQLPYEEFLDCLVDLFEIHNDGYTSFKGMLYHKYGRSISEKFLVPYNEKLYACDLDFLDKGAMGRFFPEANREEIVRNFKWRDNKSYNGSFMYPFNGAFEYVNSISAYLDSSRIKVEKQVSTINLKEHLATFTDGDSICYDRLVSTIPFPKLLSMSGVDYDESIYSWNQVLVFNLGFDRKGPERTMHWIYFPEKKYCFYRVGFYDNILHADRTSLYVEIGFRKEDIIQPQAWLARVLSDLVMSGCISDEMRLIAYNVVIMDPAYVHITKDSIDDVQIKKDLLSSFDVYSIGRYGSWTYCSIEDNIKEARELARKI